MAKVFNHYNLLSYLVEVKREHRQVDLAEVVECNRQKIHTILTGRPDWVYPDVKKWRTALGLKRLDGDYFELLAIIAAYPSSSKRERMLLRAFHLAGRLEEKLNPSEEIATSLVYWLDPVASHLRNLTDFVEFPSGEEQIPAWVASRLVLVGALAGIPKQSIPNRIAQSWSWLKKIGAVYFSEETGRWEKKEPMAISEGKRTGIAEDIRSASLLIRHTESFSNFTDEMGSERMACDLFSVFSLPEDHLGILEKLCRNFIVETTRKLNYICNEEFLAELRDYAPDYYREVLEYKEKLKDMGLAPTPVDRNAKHSLVQMVVAARRLIK